MRGGGCPNSVFQGLRWGGTWEGAVRGAINVRGKEKVQKGRNPNESAIRKGERLNGLIRKAKKTSVNERDRPRLSG